MVWFRLLLLLLPAGMLLAEEVVEEGARLFLSNCAVCHGPEGDAVQGVDFARGRFKRASSDADLRLIITRGIAGTAMPPFDFIQPQVTALISYLKFMRSAAPSAASGDAARGRALFEGKGGCLQCHRVGQKGSPVGPDLSEVGRVRAPGSLEQSILDPDAVVMDEHMYARAVTRDGVTINGRRLNEDPTSVQLIDSNERLVGLMKRDLREYSLLKNSPMPSYRGKLTAVEINDLVKYLSSQRGVQ